MNYPNMPHLLRGILLVIGKVIDPVILHFDRFQFRALSVRDFGYDPVPVDSVLMRVVRLPSTLLPSLRDPFPDCCPKRIEWVIPATDVVVPEGAKSRAMTITRRLSCAVRAARLMG